MSTLASLTRFQPRSFTLPLFLRCARGFSGWSPVSLCSAARTDSVVIRFFCRGCSMRMLSRARDANPVPAPNVGCGSRGGKTPSEYMFSESPHIADIVRSAFHHSANPLVLQITAFRVRAVPCSPAAQKFCKIIQNRLALVGEESVSVGHRRQPLPRHLRRRPYRGRHRGDDIEKAAPVPDPRRPVLRPILKGRADVSSSK
jgi:hypothetical protein